MKDSRRSLGLFDGILLLCFLIGAGILLYPVVSDCWNRYRNQKLIASYEETVSQLAGDEYEEIWRAAEEYNASHKVNVIKGVFEEEYTLSHPYDTLLNPGGDDVMGSLEIPKIKVSLAIYHGTGSDVLEEGCGHVEGTSLPIGGAGTHAVLAAHRGLPSAKLFTDLDQIETGDLFYIKVLGETLAYEVDQIKTVLPEEMDDIAIEDGKDYVTLLTCTPYGVNTHRLLVRGSRAAYIEAAEAEAVKPAEEEEPINSVKLSIIGFVVFLLILLVLYLC